LVGCARLSELPSVGLAADSRRMERWVEGTVARSSCSTWLGLGLRVRVRVKVRVGLGSNANLS